MSEIVNEISLKDYMNDFIPSLENFCSKSPLQPTLKIVADTGKIIILIENLEDIEYTVDPFVDKKIQIKEIKTLIEKQYPIVFDKKQVLYSAEEIEQFISEGVTVKDALSLRKNIYLPRYKIVRVHHFYNEIDAYDFKTRKMIKFKVTIPLSKLLQDLLFKDKEVISTSFRQSTKFMYVVRK